MQARFELFRDRADEWRWRLRHRNGNVIATSGEGYTQAQRAQGAPARRAERAGGGGRRGRRGLTRFRLHLARLGDTVLSWAVAMGGLSVQRSVVGTAGRPAVVRRSIVGRPRR
ncbi:hypothetical protein BRC89_08300 [Halobacteriales archaeon QS_4_70_19]|nr:MAG: hypothetical protein BRC89_08300 [Halobacteriales archaeon QS_4_70_19]